MLLVYRILETGWIGHSVITWVRNRATGSHEDDFDVSHLGIWVERFVLIVATNVCGEVWC